MTGLAWYARRLSRMGPAEVLGRSRAALRIRRWRRYLADPPRPILVTRPGPPAPLPSGVLAAVPAQARTRLLATAERLMAGRGEFLGVTRTDLVAPDWAFDPLTGRRAPADAYAFDVPYREERAVGNVKQLWELSRHQYLTVLAAAFAVSGDDRYAGRVADHLKSWWAENPPLRGVHWVSGIELGIRLLSWVWVRRLLDAWPGAPGLFEENPEAVHQIHAHQRWLAAFASIGSSANNHAVAEAAGRLAAACAFDWFAESERWRAEAGRLLDEHLRHNTFPSGLNRELATEYHGLVLELGLAAALEAEAAGHPVPESTWLVLLRMTDALAAVVDRRLRPPRQGDSDDGHGLVLDGDDPGDPMGRWASLLATGEVLFGRLPWWPSCGPGDVRTALLTALARPAPPRAPRPAQRPAHFADAGLTILRDATDEIWCRCDGGPHGFLSIAAHAHADALSVEVRHDGVDVLADPGTYCYHGEPEWRSYFRSTIGHNTLELDGADQSRAGGPFLWTRHTNARVREVESRSGEVVRWCAEHDGYSRRRRHVVHRRAVHLDAAARTLWLRDEVLAAGPRPCRLAFHLGPRVEVTLAGTTARLRWTGPSGPRRSRLELPPELTWTAHRGEIDPPRGWFSPGFGRKVPATVLIGTGAVGPGVPLTTALRFDA